MEKKRSILVVDDDVDTSQIVKLILEKTGLYSVATCNQGSAALKIIQDTRPELVLLDIMMPDADGAEIAKRVQEDKSLARTRVVFMTSLVSQQEVVRNSMIGGHLFISKPISSEVLLQRVKEFFEIKH